MVVKELQESSFKVDDVIDGIVRPKQTEHTIELKAEREAQKKLLLERINSHNATEESKREELDRFQGKI